MVGLITFLLITGIQLFVIYRIIKFISKIRFLGNNFQNSYREKINEAIMKLKETNGVYVENSRNKSNSAKPEVSKLQNYQKTQYARSGKSSYGNSSDSVVGDMSAELDDMANKYFRKRK